MKIGERILARRKALGLSRGKVVKECSFSERTLQHYEEGVRSPKVKELQEIAAALKTTISDLIGETGKEKLTLDELLSEVRSLWLAGDLTIQQIIDRLYLDREQEEGENE